MYFLTFLFSASSKAGKALLCYLFIIIPNILVAQQAEYFQQEADYIINVRLDDSLHFLHASEEIRYVNNSADSLAFLYFHLWPNAYSGNNTCLARQLLHLRGLRGIFNDRAKIGYIDSLSFTIDGTAASFEQVDGMPDVCRIYPAFPVMPGDTVIIKTPFRVKIPDGQVSRLGHTGWSYQISQWYPKPAVYDAAGWHPLPYLDQGEFYSEFGSFDVSITIPGDYTVGASGELVTRDELQRLDQMASETDKFIMREHASGPSRLPEKTIRYQGNGIHDFAWFADREFHVLKGNVTLPRSGKQVTTYAMYTDLQAYLWFNAIEYINNAISRFSEWIGDYPYTTYTAVQSALAAGSGMEYPGLTVIGYADDAYSLDQVIAHEVCHTWFYSSLATNERRYPYLDEGMTTAYETRYLDYYYPGKKMWEVYFKNPRLARFFNIDELPVERMPELEWLINARANLDQPATLHSQEYTEQNYNSIVYFKTGKGFNLLRSWLGDDLFDSTIREYFSEWQNKHPGPADLRNIFEARSGRDLGWFFDDYLGTVKKADYAVIRLHGDSLLVKNRGKITTPVPISGIIDGKTVFTSWSDGFSGRKWIKIPPEEFKELRINEQHFIPEINFLDDNIRSKGIFRKVDKINPQLLFSIEDPERITLMYAPLLNWNRQDGLMAGFAVNNGILLDKHFEFSLMPFFSFRDENLSGKGRLAYNFYPFQFPIRKLTFSLEGMMFGAPSNLKYQLIRPGIDIYFNPVQGSSLTSGRLYGRYIKASDLSMLIEGENPVMNSFWQAGYLLERTGPMDPYNLNVGFEGAAKYLKTSMTWNYRYNYKTAGNALELRTYSGFMLREDAMNPYYSISPSSRSGRELYLFQGEFPDRFSVHTKDFWSRQMILSEGGLVTPLNDSVGYSRWLVSFTASTSLPGKAGKAPVKPYLTALFNDHPYSGSGIFFEAGIKAGIWSVFEIYVPLIVSGNISEVKSSIKDRIRFVLSLDSYLKFRLNSSGN